MDQQVRHPDSRALGPGAAEHMPTGPRSGGYLSTVQVRPVQGREDSELSTIRIEGPLMLGSIPHGPGAQVGSVHRLAWKRHLDFELARIVAREYDVMMAGSGYGGSGMVVHKHWTTQLGLPTPYYTRVRNAVYRLRDRWCAVYLCRQDPEFADAKWGNAIDAKYRCLRDSCEVFDVIDAVMDRYHGSGWMPGKNSFSASEMVYRRRRGCVHSRLCRILEDQLVGDTPPSH